ncbi:putative bifunctional diguanylate cyclase/phosphodiesterase [Sphingomonas sp. CJ20]
MPTRLRALYRVFREACLLLIPVFVLALLGMRYNLAEKLDHLMDRQEHFQLDEFVHALLAAPLLYMGLLLYRSHRLRGELQLRLAAQREAETLAHHDMLTGLANRRSLTAYMDARASEAAPGTMLTLLALDLDRFKPINDTYGHDGGDMALRIIAARVQGLVAEHGIVARMGGDEFACAITHPADSALPIELTEAILHAVAKPMQLRGGLAEVSTSIGLISCAPGERSADDMLGAADFAMYRAKRAGRSTYCQFLPAMEEEMRERAQLELDMHSGINRGEFIPYFQPIVALSSGAVMGFEALARWRHPVRGVVPPDTFIPIAEDAGMIQDLGFAVLRRACIDARHWPHHLTLSVNISPLQLNDPWLAQRVLQVLLTTGFPPARLVVEITESRLVRDIDAARAILASLKSAGIQIALDDFGTGYASLKHLRELAFNRIKIDRNFITDIRAEESSQIVRAILSLSEGLGLPVTAEGVETTDSAEVLAALGCEYGQGYLYSRPVAADEALKIATSSQYPGHGPAKAAALPPAKPLAERTRYGT